MLFLPSHALYVIMGRGLSRYELVMIVLSSTLIFTSTALSGPHIMCTVRHPHPHPTQVGYAGQNFPSSIFPSIVGRPILRAEEAISESIDLKEIMCGEEAAAVRHSLDVRYPVENGIVKNWEDMEHLWNYTYFDKLKIDPAGHKILLTEPPMNPTSNREQLVERMTGAAFDIKTIAFYSVRQHVLQRQ